MAPGASAPARLRPRSSDELEGSTRYRDACGMPRQVRVLGTPLTVVLLRGARAEGAGPSSTNRWPGGRAAPVGAIVTLTFEGGDVALQQAHVGGAVEGEPAAER